MAVVSVWSLPSVPVTAGEFAMFVVCGILVGVVVGVFFVVRRKRGGD